MAKNKLIFSLLFVTTLLFSCSNNSSEKTIYTFKVHRHEEFGSAEIECSSKDFLNLPFKYGDSLNISFKSGFIAEDVPYFSEFYARTGHLLLVLTSALSFPLITQNNYGNSYENLGLKENDEVSISLYEKSKYLSVEESFNLRLSYYRDDYSTDEVFSNFYEIDGSKLKENIFYRSSSPCDNKINRATYCDSVISKNHIQKVINIPNNIEEYKAYDSSLTSPYYDSLVKNNDVIFIDLANNFFDLSFIKAVSYSLNIIYESLLIDQNLKILIHCTEGKDRTGFFSLLIQSLVGTPRSEMIDNFLNAYVNLFFISLEDEIRVNNIIFYKVDDYLDYFLELSGEACSYQIGARNYLLMGGFEETKIDNLISLISK